MLVEEFCIECDTSSTQQSGEYIELVWHCDKCVSKAPQPKLVPQYLANKIFKKLREELEDE